jgi:hypothetical protein
VKAGTDLSGGSVEGLAKGLAKGRVKGRDGEGTGAPLTDRPGIGYDMDDSATALVSMWGNPYPAILVPRRYRNRNSDPNCQGAVPH